MHTTAIDPRDILKRAGSKLTPGRVALIKLLAAQQKPLTVEELKTKIGDTMNAVTLYRSLEALTEAGLLERSDLRHGHAHYELKLGRPHHHHIVCTTCGRIEDIELPHPSLSGTAVSARSKEFAKVHDYLLEFYGTCKKCAKAQGR
jgi:Fe2+ or Zn2+ uptake regulation protein